MILADHCVFTSTVRLLRNAGYFVTRLKELINPDATDGEVLKLATHQGLLLLTNDKDFGNTLIYPPAEHGGVIVLKINAETEAQVHNVLLRLLQDHDRKGLRQKLAVVDGKKYRLRT